MGSSSLLYFSDCYKVHLALGEVQGLPNCHGLKQGKFEQFAVVVT